MWSINPGSLMECSPGFKEGLMKFGIFTIVPWHENRTQEQAISEALETVELADSLGIEEAWFGEHHFSRHGLLSGMFSFIGNVAARAKRIKIGTAVVILPFHNPIHVASESAMLDILTGGRLMLGVGSGYQRQEFEGLGVDLEESRERFREHLDVIIGAWSEDKLTFHGKYTNVDDLWVVPKPLQDPHPPVYIAVSTSPASVEYAASRNTPIIVGGPTAVMGQAPEVIQRWRGDMDRFGHEHSHIDPPVAMNIYVTPTMEEAETDPVGLEDFSTKILAKVGSPIGKDGRIPKGYEQWANRQRDREMTSESSRHAGMPLLRGTPEVVAERLSMVREKGINRIIASFGFPGLAHEKTMRSIELFATKVLPNFQEAPAGVSDA
jgi:alkanesulfonate monooxygenase SsuD/methylene tetrahydromethanopterin reductase-like flavin-dependent oxidoreductase (luciferase family)